MDKRMYDVVILGATGFTGRLVAEYFLAQYGLDGDLKWAIAGRNEGKLESIKSLLGNDKIPHVVADSGSTEDLHNLVQSTKVVCTTVGPYALYGSGLLAACVEHETHYCDLTGEVQWMRKMIDGHHDIAAKKGVKIVHTCGFDSIPSDMGVYFMQKEIKEKSGKFAKKIKMRVRSMVGKFSGGTIASLNNVLSEAAEDKSIYKILNNPYGLNPQGEQDGPDQKDLMKVVYDDEIKQWICPFVMAGINTKVVRRSNALMDYPYEKSFRYDEAVATGDGFKGRMKGMATTAILGLLMGGKPGSFMSNVVGRFLPKPGEGPNKEERESGFFVLDFYAVMEDGKMIKGRVTGDKDPGYGSTSKMLGESAVCLAKDKLSDIGGILTPSAAMGDALLQRLQDNAGLTFELKSK
ncbi:MAG: saccharopine dehydrogenase NADP-binding domain-containing protein [Bacteroidia bacterium]|nr:saccharopine dehydrogenase NADP-binding domain-containing protein [Bacteroidia bacterium]